MPLYGSLIFHLCPSLPPNHGGYAGLSVPIVSVPELTVGQFATGRPVAVAVTASAQSGIASRSRRRMP